MAVFTDGSLWLTFRLDGTDYCILSDYIESITMPERIETIPGSAETLAGATPYGGTIISVVEMRKIFGRIDLKTYTEQFSIMKDMHVSWVQDLERYVREGGTFSKTVDPHKCKFGMWYDSFTTDNNRLNRLLKKINRPHEAIHRRGAEIVALREADGGHEAAIAEKLAEAQAICHEEIVPLLDRLIDIYRAVNRGVVLVVNDGVFRTGLLVDDVRTLIPCERTNRQPFTADMRPSRFVGDMILHNDTVYFEINMSALLAPPCG